MKNDIATLKALGVVVALGAMAHAGLPYLPLVGPPPLRVQPVPEKRASFVLETTPAPVTPAVTVPVTNAPTVDLKAAVDTNLAVNAVATTATPETNATASVGETISTSVFTLPAPDLIGITPQMLATYFRPMQFGGSNATVVLPLPLSFQPPQAPQKSSHAEYILK